MENNEGLGRKAQPSTWQGRLRGTMGALTALALAGGIAVTSIQPAQADYYRRHHHHGGRGAAVVGGIIGGLALGALLTAPRYHDGPYYDDADYDAPPPPPSAYCKNYKHVDWKRHVWIDERGRAHPCL